MKEYFSHGKLLITGEYLVLDGANALAIPTRFGQSLFIENTLGQKITWQSIDEKGHIWFEDTFYYNQSGQIHSNSKATEPSRQLIQILETARQLNPVFLMPKSGVTVKTKLDFPNDWGLGTSSTLINNIAKWAKVDAYDLLAQSFGGSGYDIAVAQQQKPITYQIKDQSRVINSVEFSPPFKDCLYFIHLNKKQNSREGIAHYKANISNLSNQISNINAITSKVIECKNLGDFELLIDQHEDIISNIINQKPVKQVLFNDYQGSIKSLGAWGGDFFLATSKHDPTAYFKSKGFNTVISYKDMTIK